jgi:hypothetical protein
MKFDYSSSRETCVRRERSKNAVVSAVESYSSHDTSSSGFEASLRAKGVMLEVHPSKEFRKGYSCKRGLQA